MGSLDCVELCAGAGGQALGLEQAGFWHAAVAEADPDACATLRANRPEWKVAEGDIAALDGQAYQGMDLIAGGLPCPPFSVGGRQLGEDDERNLFPAALGIIRRAYPRAVMIENVRGLGQPRFAGFRSQIRDELRGMGYTDTWWRLIRCSDYGVPQLRPRTVLIAIRAPWGKRFTWPQGAPGMACSTGTALYELMAASGWEGAYCWAIGANKIAPTIVGGSKKHGGPDLGPTRSRQAWKALGVDGGSIAAEAPGPGYTGMPRLTAAMAARLQGFPDDWVFRGTKTSAYRQIGNAFPPPVARAFGEAIAIALAHGGRR